MSIWSDLLKTIADMPESELLELLRYARQIHTIDDDDQEEPTPADLAAIAKGDDEYEKGETISWEDLKREMDIDQ